MAVVGDAHQDFGQAPELHQHVLDVVEFRVEHVALRRAGAQRRIGALAALQLECELRRVQPQQHLGEVVQLRGLVQHHRIMIGAVDREAGGEARRAVRAQQHVAQAGQRLGMIGELVLDRWLRAERAEERRDAHQHQRLDDRLGVRQAPIGALRRGIDQHLERHQRIAADGLGDDACVDVVLDQPHLLDRGRGAREHGNLEPLEVPHPAIHIAGRVECWGGRLGTHGGIRNSKEAVPDVSGTASYSVYRTPARRLEFHRLDIRAGAPRRSRRARRR